jgi:glycosyltransferase involved in cell wall biosynthesis
VATRPAQTDVTIVIPAWGDYAGKHLDEALESIRDQDFAAQVIVVDNASDPPLAIPGVTVIRSEQRLSVGAARNLGLASVDTPFVMFWDADDVMLPGTVRFLREEIAAEHETVLVAAAILEGDPPIPHRWPRPWTYALARWRRSYAFAHSIWSLFPSTGASIMRSEAARAHGYADENSGEDWVLGVSLAFRGRIRLEPRPGRIYRQHATSLWATQSSPAQLRRNASVVRGRIRADAGIPRWARALLPVIAAGQILAITVVRPIVKTVRATRPRPRSAS